MHCIPDEKVKEHLSSSYCRQGECSGDSDEKSANFARTDMKNSSLSQNPIWNIADPLYIYLNQFQDMPCVCVHLHMKYALHLYLLTI